MNTLSMIAIRPPEYFPRLCYLALMACVETFVLADTFQYSRQSFQNRTRLRNPQGWQWISIPLKAHQHGSPIAQVRIRQSVPWQRQHWKALAFNYRSTPYFEYYEPELAALFDTDWASLGELTCATVERLHRWLKLPCRIVRASHLSRRPDTLPAVLDAFAGAPLATSEEAAAHDARCVSSLRVVQFDHPVYRQPFEGFEPGMSTLDLLFNYGPAARSVIEQGIRVEERSFSDAGGE